MLPNMLHVVSCLHVSTSCRWHNDAWNPAARASFKGIKEVPLVWKLYILWFDRPSSLIPWTLAQNITKALQKRRFGSTFGTGSSSKSFCQGFLWTLSSAQGARAKYDAFKIPVSLKYDSNDSTNFFFSLSRVVFAVCLPSFYNDVFLTGRLQRCVGSCGCAPSGLNTGTRFASPLIRFCWRNKAWNATQAKFKL